MSFPFLVLGELAALYTNAIMSSKATSMEYVVMSISQIENEAAVREATEHYEKMMKERVRFPTETDKEFTELSIECEKEALQIFMKKSFKDCELSFQKQYLVMLYHGYLIVYIFGVVFEMCNERSHKHL